MWELDSILEQSISQIAAGKARVESCLLSYPAMADELEPLLLTAEKLWAIPKPDLSPDARARIEDRVLAAAAADPLLRPARNRRSLALLPRWRWAFSALTVIVIFMFLMMTTLVSASADALPGAPLYPVKLATEDAWLWLAPPRAEPALHLRFARRRLVEFRTLAQQGVFDQSVLEAMVVEVEAALAGAEELSPDRALPVLNELTLVIVDQQQTLSQRLADLPTASRRHVEFVLLETAALAARVEAFRSTLVPSGAPVSPEATATVTLSPTSGPTATLEAVGTVTPTQTVEPTPPPTVTPTETLAASPTPEPTPETGPAEPPPEPTATQPPPEPTATQPPPEPTATQPPPEPTTRVPPGLTKTPEPPGQTKTPKPTKGDG